MPPRLLSFAPSPTSTLFQKVAPGFRGLGDASGAVTSSTTIDFNSVMADLNGLTASRATSYGLVAQGIKALDAADSIAQNVGPSGSYSISQPGEQNKRDTIRSHLQYYNDNPDQLESGFYDIKNWVIQAFVEYNAALEVDNSSYLWPSIHDAIVALPSTIGQAVAAVASTIGGAAGAAAGGAALGLLQGLFQNPIGIAVLAGAGYYLYSRTKRRTP
jgi:hypothetical protein